MTEAAAARLARESTHDLLAPLHLLRADVHVGVLDDKVLLVSGR